MIKKQIAVSLDKMGRYPSVICKVHCLAIPILCLLGFDSLLEIVDHDQVQLMVILLALSTGMVWSFLSGSFKHRQHFITGYAHFQNVKWKRYIWGKPV